MTLRLVQPDPWYRDPKNLAQLWRWLREQGYEPEDPAYFMEKGFKWQESWDDFQRFEREDAQEQMLSRDLFDDDPPRTAA